MPAQHCSWMSDFPSLISISGFTHQLSWIWWCWEFPIALMRFVRCRLSPALDSFCIWNLESLGWQSRLFCLFTSEIFMYFQFLNRFYQVKWLSFIFGEKFLIFVFYHFIICYYLQKIYSSMLINFHFLNYLLNLY